MVDSPIPTRAEVLDVANAVLDGSDAVMLSQETASGRHPDKAVAAMRSICEAAERQFEASAAHAPTELHRTDQAIAMAAMMLAHRAGVRAIIALTESGATAQWLSRFRSRIPIYAMSRHQSARQKMALFRDVCPVAFDPQGGGVTHATRLAVELLHAQGRLAIGDRVVVTTGDHTGLLGGTNTLKLLRVGSGGTPEGMANL
jgi:pyruvate kinase